MGINFNATLEFCPGVDSGCDPVFSHIYLAANVPSIVCNIVHLVVLSQIESLRKNRSLFALYLHIGIVDAVSALTNILGAICPLTQAYHGLPILTGAFVGVLYETPIVFKYVLVCLSAYDRYIAICYPFKDAFIRRHMNISIVLTWFLLSCLLLGSTPLVMDAVCIRIDGATITWGSDETFSLIAFVVLTAPLILMITCTVKLAREVKRIHSREKASNITVMSNEVVSAARYVILMISSLVICLIPLCVGMLLWGLRTTFPPHHEYYIYRYLQTSYVICHCHGIVDTLIYGWITPIYRRTARKFFCNSIVSRQTVDPTG